MKPNQVHRCRGCGELNPKNVDETRYGLVHVKYYLYTTSEDEAEGDWDICGEVELDVLETFRNSIEQHRDKI